MVQRSIVAISAVIVLFLSSTIFAQNSLNYYSATVPVKSQVSDEKKRAAGKALAQVLARMSGELSISENEYLATKMANALAYVEQFQFQPLNNPELKEQKFTEQLSLTFSPQVVRRLLDEAQLPFWPEKRPVTLVWLVEDSVDGKRLLTQLSESLMVDSLTKASKERGVPLVYPVLDLDDQLAISEDDVWDFEEETIKSASERYGADVILVGRFSITSKGDFLSMWQFFHADSTLSYDVKIEAEGQENQLDETVSESVMPEQSGDQVLAPLVNFLSARYALQPSQGGSGKIVMQLSGVKDFGAYRQSLDYLAGLAAIKRVNIAAIRQDTLLLYVETEIGIKKLLSVFSLDNFLKIQQKAMPEDVPIWQQIPEGTAENPLQLNWAS